MALLTVNLQPNIFFMNVHIKTILIYGQCIASQLNKYFNYAGLTFDCRCIVVPFEVLLYFSYICSISLA